MLVLLVHWQHEEHINVICMHIALTLMNGFSFLPHKPCMLHTVRSTLLIARCLIHTSHCRVHTTQSILHCTLKTSHSQKNCTLLRTFFRKEHEVERGGSGQWLWRSLDCLETSLICLFPMAINPEVTNRSSHLGIHKQTNACWSIPRSQTVLIHLKMGIVKPLLWSTVATFS